MNNLELFWIKLSMYNLELFWIELSMYNLELFWINLSMYNLELFWVELSMYNLELFWKKSCDLNGIYLLFFSHCLSAIWRMSYRLVCCTFYVRSSQLSRSGDTITLHGEKF